MATSPTGAYPKDTLAATESIVRYPSHQADKVFELLNYFYPQPTSNPASSSGLRRSCPI